MTLPRPVDSGWRCITTIARGSGRGAEPLRAGRPIWVGLRLKDPQAVCPDHRGTQAAASWKKAPGTGDLEAVLGASEEGKAACQGRGPESSPGLPQLGGAHPEPRIIGVWGREAPHEAVWC